MRSSKVDINSNRENFVVRKNIGDAAVVFLPKDYNTPVVLSSPHSGTNYSEEFLSSSRLDLLDLRRSEDCYVSDLFELAPMFGVPLISAIFPRSYIDPNREPYELDPDMFEGALPAFVKTNSDRVRAGFGTIAKLVANGAEIYREKINFEEAQHRIKFFYKPYHDELSQLILNARERYGFVVLLDCHSMPSCGGLNDRDQGRRRADIVLGDCYGKSCSGKLVDYAEHTLSGLGLSVSRNDPYAGAYTTKHYGKPAKNIHALQVEINRSLYMDELLLERSTGYSSLVKKLGRFVEVLSTMEM